MHELSLAQSLLETALRHPALPLGGRVTRLFVRVGALSGVDVDSLAFCLELVSKDTPAEGARLDVEVTPPRGRCRVCYAERVLETPNNPPGWAVFSPSGVGECTCGEQAFDLVGGHELTLVEMEVESG